MNEEAFRKGRVSLIVEALYPIIYPIEQQDCAIQAKHHAIVERVAQMVYEQLFLEKHDA